jgi:hypothetical protein
MCRQKLRNEVPAAGKPALSCHPRSVFPCSRLTTLGLATTFETPRQNAISFIVTSSRWYGVRTDRLGGVRGPIGRQRRGRAVSGSGACQPESYHRMRCRQCAPRTAKSRPRPTTLRQHQSARWSARGRSLVRASRRTLASHPAAVDPSPDDVHSVQVLHCRRRGTRARCSDRRVSGCMQYRPRCCRGDHRDRRRDRGERAIRSRSLA